MVNGSPLLKIFLINQWVTPSLNAFLPVSFFREKSYTLFMS